MASFGSLVISAILVSTLLAWAAQHDLQVAAAVRASYYTYMNVQKVSMFAAYSNSYIGTCGYACPEYMQAVNLSALMDGLSVSSVNGSMFIFSAAGPRAYSIITLNKSS